MARFRRKARSYARRMFKRSRGRSHSGSEGVGQTLLAGGIYGGARGFIVNAISPYTNQLGSYGTPAALGILGYFMAKKGSGMVKNAGKAVLTVEAANLVNGFVGQSTQSSQPQSTLVFGGWQ